MPLIKPNGNGSTLSELKVCADCGDNIAKNNAFLFCDGCDDTYHLKCKNITNFKKVVKQKQWFCCHECKNASEMSTNEIVTVVDPAVDNDMIKAIRDVNKNITMDIQKSQQFLSDKFDDLSKSFALLHEENKSLKLRIEHLEKRQLEIEHSLSYLQSHHDKIANANSSNCLFISGVSFEETADVPCEVKKIFNIVGCGEDILESITDYTKLFANAKSVNFNASKPRKISGILIKLNSVQVKNEILLKRRNKKINTKDLGYETDHTIFIREWLSPIKLELYKKCRVFKEQLNFKFCWTKNGKIMMRKSEKSDVFFINSVLDLHKLKS